MALLCLVDGFCPDGFSCINGRCVPDDIGNNPPPDQLPGLGQYVRKRYTSNVVFDAQMNAKDALFDVLCVTDRGYFRQNSNGKLGMCNKKPVPYAFSAEALSVGETAIDVDNVTDWINKVDNWLLISPHTTKSEIRRVTAAAYSTAQNSIVLSSTGGLFTITGFSGCDGANTPATGSIQVTSVGSPPVTATITIGSTVLEILTGADDSEASIAAYIAGIIATHPALFRKFIVEFDGIDTVTLTPRLGTLTLDAGLLYAKDAPLVDPVTAPTLGSSGIGTDLPAGVYYITYSAVNAAGETLIAQIAGVSISGGEQIDVSTVSLPSGATSLKWYISPEASSTKLRYQVENNGSAFAITTLPRLSAVLPPDLNRTGAEVMRVAAVFSDREEPRSATSRSNVILASFQWDLDNREKTVNRVDLKYVRASDDWAPTELRLKDDASIAKTKKISPFALNGQAIDNDDQAYRICSGTLAEKQDADFFYRWKATKIALLLQEGDVVAITDDSSGVINFPVMLEEINFEIPTASLPKAFFVGRKYASTLYDDSVVERDIPISIEPLPTTPLVVDALVIAGGGGGGAAYGGGGGAGGFLYSANHTVAAGAYSVTVGAGGAGSPGVDGANVGTNGSNSLFDGLTATGGGGGAGFLPANGPGAAGGSGGGGTFGGVGGAGTSGQGFGGGTSGPSGSYGGGAGGGAGAVGGNGSTTVGGAGGAGIADLISGASVTYAGGGGGGVYQSGTGGAGGTGGGGAGGATASLAGSNGTANTGGGGGGGGYITASGTHAGGNGGSGVVIIRYRTADFGTCTGGTITTDGPFTVHKFTSSGTFTVVA